jgi:hypothetical protein
MFYKFIETRLFLNSQYTGFNTKNCQPEFYFYNKTFDIKGFVKFVNDTINRNR